MILDANGNVKSWADGANSIYVDFGDGDVRLLSDKLARTGVISPEAFSNALLNIVKDMKLPGGYTFDTKRLWGKFN